MLSAHWKAAACSAKSCSRSSPGRNTSMQRRADPLRIIADRLSIPSLAVAIKQPGVAEALRVTVQYHDGKHPDQVATLLKMQSSGPVKLAVHYRRTIDKPLILDYIIEPERFALLSTTLRKLTFDKLDDYPDIPWHGEDMWL